MLYRLADLNVEIKAKYAYTYRMCNDYLHSDQSAKADITVEISEEEIAAEKGKASGFSDGYCESLCVYRRICNRIPSMGAVMFHSSVLSLDGDGYAFFGKSGAGKSTHTRMWCELFGDRAEVINGDKPIYRFDGERLIAYGTPWCGKEGLNKNKSVEVKALCLIKKAPENSIRRLSLAEAPRAVIEQVIMPKDAQNVIATLEFLDRALAAVPVYELSCNISTDAARLSYETMKGEKI